MTYIKISKRRSKRFLLLIYRIRIFGAKSTLFKFALEVEGSAKRNSLVNEHLEVGLNSI